MINGVEQDSVASSAPVLSIHFKVAPDHGDLCRENNLGVMLSDQLLSFLKKHSSCDSMILHG